MLRRFLPALLLIGACAPELEVSPVHPAPHPMPARALATVQVLQTPPPAGAVEVFVITASGGDQDAQLPAVEAEAARRGCDAIYLHDPKGVEQRSVGEDATGQLNDHRTFVAAHVTAICIALPAAAPAPAPAPAPAASAPATATGTAAP